MRRHLVHRPQAAALLLAAALLMKLMVPAGFMPVAQHGALTIVPCDGYGPQQAPAASHHGGHDSHGSGGHSQPEHHHQGKQMPCDYSVLGAPGLAGGDPIAFVPPGFLRPARGADRTGDAAEPRRIAHLRPPLRGPPLA